MDHFRSGGTVADADAGDLRDTDPGFARPETPEDATGPDAHRWLVLIETTDSSANAMAFRVSGSGATGPWSLGSGSSVRGEGFSPEGRFFLRHAWAAPAYLVDFQNSAPGESTLVSQYSLETSWSPSAPLLLVQNDYFASSLTVVDARRGSPEIYDLDLDAPPRMLNPQPMWAPDGERVAFATDRDMIDMVDFRSHPPLVVPIDSKPMGLKTWDCRWSQDGRWLVCRAEPKPGTWLVAGVDTASPDLPVVALTETMDLQIDYVSWPGPDWLVFPTSDGTTSQSTYAARMDVIPAKTTVTFPGSARVSPSDPWVAYLGDCKSSSAPGVCLVQLGRDGPSQPVQVATGEPMEIGWARGGKHLNYTFWRGDHYEWWLIPNVIAGNSPVQPTNDIWWDRSWSPDSDWALWRLGVDPDQDLYAYNVAQASTQLLLEGGHDGLRWSNDGAFLAVVTADRRQVVIFAEQGSTLVELARLESTTGTFASWFLWQPVPG